MSAIPTCRVCRKCGGPMKHGEALQNTLQGYPDFPGDTHATTVSRTGPARIVAVLKCAECGYSVTAEAGAGSSKESP